MTTERRQPIEAALSPLPLERLREESGLTWRSLASRMDVNDCRRPELRLPAGPGRRREYGGDANPDPDAYSHTDANP